MENNLSHYDRSKNILYIVVLGGVLCYIAFLVSQFWALGDDIAFARWMKDGISWQNMITVYGVNGRYLGNALGVFFGSLSAGDFWWIRAIFDFICIVCMIIVAAKLTTINNKTEILKYMCVASVLLLSVDEYASVEFFAYSAGFMNYFVPTLLFLVNFFLFSHYLTTPKKYLAVFICLLAFVNCFFVELITVYLLLITIAFVVVCIIQKSNSIFSICLMCSVLLGLILMFSYGVICIDVRSEYRSSIFSKGLAIIIDNALKYSYMLIFSHIILTAFISVVSILIIYINWNRSGRNRKSLIIGLVQVCVCGMGMLVSLVYRFGNWDNTPIAFLKSDIGITVITIIYLINLGFVLFQSKSIVNFKLVVFLYFSIWVLSGILSAVSPIGWRCFLPIYVIEMLIGLNLFVAVSKYNKHLSSIITIVMIVIFFAYNAHIAKGYYIGNRVEKQREQYLSEQMDKKVSRVEIPDSVCFADSGPLRFLKNYYYYDMAGDLDIVFVPYDEWIETSGYERAF